MRVGIIGGSGMDDPKLLKDYKEFEGVTPYGNTSSKITSGKIGNSEAYIIARHGKGHTVPPSKVNFKANISALKELECDYILATTAVGSLREKIKPGNLAFPDQFIDFTRQREMTFYDQMGEVRHTPMAEPFDRNLRDTLCAKCDELDFPYNRDVTVVTVDGPRFSTKAESYMFRNWGADIINMSTCPEVILANERGIPYQAIAMSTDYDCWKDDEEPVSFELVMERMAENADKVKELLVKTIESLE